MMKMQQQPVMPLADVDIDRAALKRTDPDWLAAARQHQDVRVALLKNGEPFCATDAGALAWLGGAAFTLGAVQEVFLGLDTEGAPVFALDMGERFDLAQAPIDGLGQFSDFRAAAAVLSAFEASAAATARALLAWHGRNGFCANCGHATAAADAGWKRACPNCGAEHFPRTDPVAIMMVVRGTHCLLGRQASWPAGMWSCLAGFIEPGESLEQGAAREVLEEAGIGTDPDRAVYLFSQPWPFPSSLMIGLSLEAVSEDITIDPDELEAARWFSREEVVEMLEGRHPSAFAPPPLAVAHHLLRVWAGHE